MPSPLWYTGVIALSTQISFPKGIHWSPEWNPSTVIKAKVCGAHESWEWTSDNNSWWTSGYVFCSAPSFYSRVGLQAPALGTPLLFLSYLFLLFTHCPKAASWTPPQVSELHLTFCSEDLSGMPSLRQSISENSPPRGNRGWGRWMASPTQLTWVWANSKRQWRTGKPSVL